MAPRRLNQDLVTAVMSAIGARGGNARAKALSPAERSAIARKAGLASRGGGWPKGKKRGTSPLKGRKVAR